MMHPYSGAVRQSLRTDVVADRLDPVTSEWLETESGTARRLLAAVAGFVLTLTLLGLALAATPAAAQNGVGAHHQMSILTVGAEHAAAPIGVGVEGLPLRQLVSATGVAAKSGDEFVNLASDARTSHILDGEVRPNGSFGGGHRAGTGYPNKSEFPAGWSDARIMHEISDVATDPSTVWRAGNGPADSFVNGTRDGVDIEVLIRNNQIWTGYPTNLPRN